KRYRSLTSTYFPASARYDGASLMVVFPSRMRKVEYPKEGTLARNSIQVFPSSLISCAGCTLPSASTTSQEVWTQLEGTFTRAISLRSVANVLNNRTAFGRPFFTKVFNERSMTTRLF